MSAAIIGEQDILKAFVQLATWLAKRNLHATTIVSGGPSMLLQTHLRDECGVSDIDLAFTGITCDRPGKPFTYDAFFDADGTAYLRRDGKNAVFEEFCAQYPSIPLDKKYWQSYAGILYGRFNCAKWEECVPVISLLDENGNGLDVRATKLSHISYHKGVTLNCVMGPDDGPFYEKTVRDLYGLYALCKREWTIEARPPSDDMENIQRRAALGFKQLPLTDIRIHL